MYNFPYTFYPSVQFRDVIYLYPFALRARRDKPTFLLVRIQIFFWVVKKDIPESQLFVEMKPTLILSAYVYILVRRGLKRMSPPGSVTTDVCGKIEKGPFNNDPSQL